MSAARNLAPGKAYAISVTMPQPSASAPDEARLRGLLATSIPARSIGGAEFVSLDPVRVLDTSASPTGKTVSLRLVVRAAQPVATRLVLLGLLASIHEALGRTAEDAAVEAATAVMELDSAGSAATGCTEPERVWCLAVAETDAGTSQSLVGGAASSLGAFVSAHRTAVYVGGAVLGLGAVGAVAWWLSHRR